MGDGGCRGIRAAGNASGKGDRDSDRDRHTCSRDRDRRPPARTTTSPHGGMSRLPTGTKRFEGDLQHFLLERNGFAFIHLRHHQVTSLTNVSEWAPCSAPACSFFRALVSRIRTAGERIPSASAASDGVSPSRKTSSATARSEGAAPADPV
jgi:hypothetical protein